jgi:hypothetical protein
MFTTSSRRSWEMLPLQALRAFQIVLIITAVSGLFLRSSSSDYAPDQIEALRTSVLQSLSIFSAQGAYTYESRFSQGELGVINRSYWVPDPQLISGAYYIEDGMLKIESNNRFQVGFGMNWKSPTYQAGWEDGGWTPWLPLYSKYHCEVTFAKPEVQWFAVENWIAWENGMSITAMVWYQHGNLMYSYGAFPNQGGYTVVLGRFSLPNEFNVTIDADYKAMNMTINWDNHIYNVPLWIEGIGTIPKPFTHFQITLMEPGTIYVKNLKVILS